MIKNIKDFLKTQPHLYDVVKKVFRLVSPKTDPIYNFFDKFSKSHNRKVTFIQVGANDGLRSDPIREFIARDSWSGILVEPLPTVYELLKKNYRYARKLNLVFVNAAITASDNENLSFWTFSDEFLDSLSLEQRLDYQRKSSFDYDHVLRCARWKQQSNIILKEIKIPCVTLSSLKKEYWPEGKIDLLVIDAEGYESSIIPSIDFDIVNPEAIYFESHNLGPEKNRVFEFLFNNNYKITEINGDSVAVKTT